MKSFATLIFAPPTTSAARSAFEEAAVLARMQREPEQLARAALGFGSGPAGFEVAQFDRAQVALLREALDALQGETPLRAWLLARLSVAAGLGASDGDRRAHAEQAIGLVRDAGQPAALAYALSAVLLVGLSLFPAKQSPEAH